MREKLLSGDLWAARIDKLWKEVDDGVYWIRACWYMIPEETVSGRQPHNLKRELYLTNDFADIEMECILRHCSVKCPKEFSKASNDGDDVCLCEYEYDVHWRSFKRLAELVDGDSDSDQEWNGRKEEKVDDSDEEMELDDGVLKSKRGGLTSASGGANSCKGRFFGIEKVGMKLIP
ncbi:Bromo adjacent homology (BAH) domain [Arabidopsis suecica]|uniref:Bromo adjacent homology (BAH) domain n=1 Tax=Arabidopsis suecica TaxID=45249 RepID=A0A8T2E6H8_ARASU|nr:Bromo adjacent homology (BAH) domain [Arabidopsis suecica]